MTGLEAPGPDPTEKPGAAGQPDPAGHAESGPTIQGTSRRGDRARAVRVRAVRAERAAA